VPGWSSFRPKSGTRRVSISVTVIAFVAVKPDRKQRFEATPASRPDIIATTPIDIAG
jgi:hypothetical protein